MTTEPITMSTYTLAQLSNEYGKYNFRFKAKKELVTDAEIRSFIGQHPIVFTVLRGLTH